MSSGLGHLGHRSPKKNRVIDLDQSVIKLRSPMKRTMTELNRMALQHAIQIKNKELDEDSELETEDMALADKIIALSKNDGYEPAYQELEDIESPRRRTAGSPSPKKLASASSSPRKRVSASPTRTSSSPTPKKRGRPASSASVKFEDLKIDSSVKLMKIPTVDEDQDVLLQDIPVEPKALFYDGFEGYFEQQKLRTKKTSSSSMTMAPQISYDEFHRYNSLLDLFSASETDNLVKYYRQQYTQWLLELNQGFNLIFYGVGSKRLLMIDFARNFLLDRLPKSTKCIVANGYNTEFHPRTLLKTIWKSAFNRRPPTWHMVDSVRELRNEFAKHNKQLIVVLNNIDGESLRQDRYHYVLSELANIEQIHLICSMDNINMPLFWNSSIMASFNFIWHNVTQYKPYTTETSFKDPLSIGRSNEFVGSKGAKYVLSALTSNAKNLYKNLLIQQLEKIDMTLTSEQDLETRGRIKGSIKLPILFREFYDLCVSEFITSNEISFRTVLREFIEHRMCNLTRTSAGTEVIYVPFTVDEMEKILEGELL